MKLYQLSAPPFSLAYFPHHGQAANTVRASQAKYYPKMTDSLLI